MEYTSEEIPCPGHKDEFEEEHRNKGLTGFWFFILVILFPVTVAASIGYLVWICWDGKFGRIQLGTEDGGRGGGAFDADKPWIQYPVMAISAIGAAIIAIPYLLASLWRSGRGYLPIGGGSGGGGGGGSGGAGRRYTTRQSFARGRSDYAFVDPDEDELLGDDDDEEV